MSGSVAISLDGAGVPLGSLEALHNGKNITASSATPAVAEKIGCRMISGCCAAFRLS